MASGAFGTNIQVGGIKQVAIQPTGIPGSTYVRPQQKEAGGNLRALADALQGLNGALQNYGSAAGQSAKDPDSEENRAFADSIAGMSLQEAMAKNPEAKNRIQKDSILTLVGSKASSDFRQFITEQYNNGGFDQANGDFNSWVEGHRKKYAEGLLDQAMKAAFFRGTDNWVQQFGEADLKRKVENAMVERDTAVVDEFRMIVDDGLGRMDDPEKIANDIINQSSQNREFRGLDGKSQNETLFRLAQEYAQKGRPELVKAILNHDRGGVGPLIKVAGITDKGIALIEAAEAQEIERQDAKSFNTRTELDALQDRGALTKQHLEKVMKGGKDKWLTPDRAAQYLQTSNSNKERLLASQAREEEARRLRYRSVGEKTQITANAFSEMETLGGAQRLQDVEYTGPTGEPKVYTADQQLKDVVQRKLSQFQQMEEDLVAQNVSPAQARERAVEARIAWFDGNSIPDEQMSKRFSRVFMQASITRSLAKGEVTKELAAIADEYQQVHDLNPAYAETLVKGEKAKTFLDNYASARGSLMGKEDALIHAAMMSNRTATEVSMGTLAPKDLTKYADDVFDDADVDAEPSPDNRAWVADRLNDYTRRGLAPDEAKAKVVKTLKERSFEIHGKLVVNSGSIPNDAPELLETILADRFEVFGKAEGIPDAEDLYVEEFADGQFLVMSKSKGNAPLGKGSRIDAREMSLYRGKERKRRSELAEKARKGDEQSRAAARAVIQKDLDADLKTVERWEKKAQSGKTIPTWAAKRLRKNYEERLREFNSTPLTPPEKKAKAKAEMKREPNARQGAARRKDAEEYNAIKRRLGLENAAPAVAD